MTDRRLAGLWLDTQKAIITSNHDGQNASEFRILDTVIRDVQHGNSSENAGNNSDQTTTAKFFKEIDHLLENTEELYITGPGTAQEELKNYLHDTAQFKNLKISVDSSQQMSNEQVLDAVKSHFGA